MKKLRYCLLCKEYTLKSICCDNKTTNPHPKKFTPIDKFAKYRRKEKFGD